MTKISRLNDLQLVLLSTASQRVDGRLLPVPDSVTAGPERVQAALTLLIRRKLAEKARGGNQVTITKAGRTAIGVELLNDSEPVDLDPTVSGGTAPVSAHEPALLPPQPRAGSKAALVMELLSREGGATLDDLILATGWLPHTARAALSDLRRKGHTIASKKVEDVRVWEVVR